MTAHYCMGFPCRICFPYIDQASSHEMAAPLVPEVDRLRSENERLQMQLAACGVLASCNTSDSLERNRQMHPDFLGASVHAVIEAAQREIKLLDEVRRLRAIEAAARHIEDEQIERDGLWVTVPILVEHWNELRAALAAKGTP